ncbi:hypothetical protein ACS8FD_12545 [Psychrobacter sp. 1U2]|uniref:hypothetical protein n=1 Tax=unclassified Psychrobacter TaxID=196806 RepID=UPI0019188E2B|nr:hypothetical protein [Psychrobacter sp. Pi2-52]
MAKSKLTKNAIRFIIQKREDWYVNYTFDDIAKLLKQEFDINITEQGVSKSYRKHKDDKYFQSGQLVANNGDTEVMSKKEKYERRVRSRRTDNSVPEPYLDNNDQRDFDESAGKNYDVNEFFLK